MHLQPNPRPSEDIELISLAAFFDSYLNSEPLPTYFSELKRVSRDIEVQTKVSALKKRSFPFMQKYCLLTCLSLLRPKNKIHTTVALKDDPNGILDKQYGAIPHRDLSLDV